jgi:hypothetical protein
MKNLGMIMAAALIVSAPATGQVTSIASNNPSQKHGDPNRTVCEVEQTTGTRLGARNVCKTVLEWQQLRSEHRETVDAFEQKNTSVGCQTGNTCNGGMSPH